MSSEIITNQLMKGLRDQGVINRNLREEIEKLRAQMSQPLIGQELHQANIHRSDIFVPVISDATITDLTTYGNTLIITSNGGAGSFKIKYDDDDAAEFEFVKTDGTNELDFSSGKIKGIDTLEADGDATFKADIIIDKGDNPVTIVKTDGVAELDFGSAEIKEVTKLTTADGGSIILTGGTNPSTISKTVNSDEIVFSNDISVQNGKFSANSVEVGGQLITEVGGKLRISYTGVPGLDIHDSDGVGDAATGYISFFDSDNTGLAFIFINSGDLNLSLLAGDVIITGGLRPEADNTRDLGKVDKNWGNIYTGGITLGGTNINLIFDRHRPKHGFADSSTVTLSFVDGTRTFTITPDGTEYYYQQGIRYTLSSPDTVVISATEGMWYIYFVGGTLTASQTPWSLLDTKVPVCAIYWDNTNSKKVYFGVEVHGVGFGQAEHNYNHEAFGCRYETGFGITTYGGGNADQITITTGECHDEDIEIAVTDGTGSGRFEQDLSTTDAYSRIPVFYRSGASAWRKRDATDHPFYDNAGNDRVHYNKLNGTWASAESTNAARYVAYFIYATNDKEEPIIAIMGQDDSEITLANARTAYTPDSIAFGGLPSEEMKILHRIIIKANSIQDATDYRQSQDFGTGAGQTQSHSSLTDLSNPDHPQYLRGDELLDEDDMASDSSVLPASQQSIKAYVDTALALKASLTGAAFTGDVSITDAEAVLQVIGTTDNAVIQLRSDANEYAILEFYHGGAQKAWIGLKENSDDLQFWAVALNDFPLIINNTTGYITTLKGFGTNIPISADKGFDIGADGTAWDDVWADDFQNQSAWKKFTDPLSEIDGVTGEDGGHMDHVTTPVWMRTIDKVKVTSVVEKDGLEATEDYWDTGKSRVSTTSYSINRMQVLLIQAIQQLKKRIEQLEAN